MKKSLVFLFAMTLVLSGCSAFDSDVDGDISSIPVPEEWVDSEGNVSLPDNILTDTTTTKVTTSREVTTYEPQAGSVITTSPSISTPDTETEQTEVSTITRENQEFAYVPTLDERITSKDMLSKANKFLGKFSDYYKSNSVPASIINNRLSSNLYNTEGEGFDVSKINKYAYFKLPLSTDGEVSNEVYDFWRVDFFDYEKSYRVLLGTNVNDLAQLYLPTDKTLYCYGIATPSADVYTFFVPLLIGTDEDGYVFCKSAIDMLGLDYAEIPYLDENIG